MIIWGLALGLPLVAFGVLSVVRREKAQGFVQWFETSRPVAVALTIVAWFWTAHELDMIGIDVFDMVTQRFPGELWILAAVLSYLTVIWMPKSLAVRALTALLMLFPASLFRTTRLLLPESGVGTVHVFVAFAYVCAVIGMYGMFYPWRLEKGLGIVLNGPTFATRLFGASLAVLGVCLVIAGFVV